MALRNTLSETFFYADMHKDLSHACHTSKNLCTERTTSSGNGGGGKESGGARKCVKHVKCIHAPLVSNCFTNKRG